jgi:hypothetical protein
MLISEKNKFYIKTIHMFDLISVHVSRKCQMYVSDVEYRAVEVPKKFEEIKLLADG